MSHDPYRQQQPAQPLGGRPATPARLELPRFELPRFEMAPRRDRPAGAPAAPAAPAPAPAPARTAYRAPAAQPQHAQQPRYAATPQYAQHPQHAAQPAYASHAPAQAAPAHHHVAPQQHQHPQLVQQPPQHAAAPGPQSFPQQRAGWAPTAPPRIAATPTRPAARVTYSPPPTPAETGLLQKLTPAHMAVIMVLATIMVILTATPGSMSAPTPNKLPALAAGGGASSDTLPMARSTAAVTSAAATGGDAGAAKVAATGARAGTPVKAPYAIPKSSTKLTHGGIPSPAATAMVRIKGGGRAPAGTTGSIQFRGMPSPAAAEKLGPKTLPFTPTDGVTLPRSGGERDSWAVDTHYGATATLPMAAPVARPLMTPGELAARDEAVVATADVIAGSSPVQNAGGAVSGDPYAF